MSATDPKRTSRHKHLTEGITDQGAPIAQRNQQIAGARPFSTFLELTDSARAVHSLYSPATLPEESGLPVRF